MSQGSVVSIVNATGWTVQGLNLGRVKGIFLFSQNDQTSSGVHPASCSVGTGVLSPGVKQLELEVNHSLPSSAKVRNEWSSTSTPHVCVHGVDKEILLFTINARTVMMVFDLGE